MKENVIEEKIDPRLLSPDILEELKAQKSKEWNDRSLILIIRLRRAEIDPLKNLIKKAFPNAFICFSRQENENCRYTILSDEDLQICRGILLEKNRREIEGQ